MKRIKKASSKSTKNFVTVGFVLTVAAVVMYLLSLLTDGVLLAQLATLKNFIENGTWTKIFNPFVWAYRFIDVIGDILSMSGLWLLVASAVIVWMKQKKQKLGEIWVTLSFGLNALGLLLLFGENFALKSVSTIGDVVGRCLWAFPYFFAAVMMSFLTVAMAKSCIPKALKKLAALLSVCSMVLVAVEAIVDWTFDFAYTAASNTNALFDVSVVGFGDVLVTVSILLVIIFSMLTLFAQMFAFKNVAVEIAVIGEETQEVSEAVADSQKETL